MPKKDQATKTPPSGSCWGDNAPFALQIEITSHCNLHCKMCPLTLEQTNSSVRPGHISDVLWEQLVPLAREVGQVIIAGFGEPLTNSKCLPLLRQLDACSIRMSITSNGTALLPRICQELVRLRYLTQINISIDSPDPQVYREIRGGDVEKAFKGLQNLLGCIDNPERVSVSSIIMRSTVASLVDFPRRLARYGVRKYVLQGLLDYNASTFGEEAFVNKDSLASWVDKIRQNCLQNGIELSFTLPQRLDLEMRDPGSANRVFYQKGDATEKMARQCHLPWEIPYIDKDGRLFPCCIAAAKGEGDLGRLQEESLPAIWNGANFRRFREDILDGRTTPHVCQHCKAAPLGEHPFRRYGARIVPAECFLEGVNPLTLVVQNTGTISWLPENRIRIGTSNPRDHDARCAHSSWLTSNRIVSFREAIVLPGAKATFVFEIDPLEEGEREFFQLVADGTCWLPNTRFSIAAVPKLRCGDKVEDRNPPTGVH